MDFAGQEGWLIGYIIGLVVVLVVVALVVPILPQVGDAMHPSPNREHRAVPDQKTDYPKDALWHRRSTNSLKAQ